MIRAAVVSRHAVMRKGIAAALFAAEIEVTGEADDLGDDRAELLDAVDVVVVDVSALVEHGHTSLSHQVLTAFGATMRATWQEPLHRIASLSPREREVLNLIGDGLSNQAIASRLDLAERTVKTHVGRVLTKLRVESRLQAGLVATAERLSSVDPPGYSRLHSGDMLASARVR